MKREDDRSPLDPNKGRCECRCPYLRGSRCEGVAEDPDKGRHQCDWCSTWHPPCDECGKPATPRLQGQTPVCGRCREERAG